MLKTKGIFSTGTFNSSVGTSIILPPYWISNSIPSNAICTEMSEWPIISKLLITHTYTITYYYGNFLLWIVQFSKMMLPSLYFHKHSSFLLENPLDANKHCYPWTPKGRGFVTSVHLYLGNGSNHKFCLPIVRVSVFQKVNLLFLCSMSLPFPGCTLRKLAFCYFTLGSKMYATSWRNRI